VSAAGGASGDTCRTILAVFDDSHVLRCMETLLHRAGYRVLTAGSPEEARQFASHGRTLDLLLTDYLLPDTNGLELTRWFRTQHPHISVLMMSDEPELPAMVEGMFDPPVACLPKPCRFGQLAAAIDNMLVPCTA
jgi:DNA-binding NtrC family response regulator